MPRWVGLQLRAYPESSALLNGEYGLRAKGSEARSMLQDLCSKDCSLIRV